MPKKPNYNYERQQRDRAKAVKKAEKLAAKKTAKDQKVNDAEAGSEN